MKLTFISEQDGLKVEMNFEAEFIYDIEDAFKNFLRGSGFTVQDEEDMYTKQENVDTSEECVHESDIKLWVGLSDTEAEIYGIKSKNT